MFKILAVDQNKGVSKEIANYLEKRGHRAFAAGSISDAIALFEKESPQMVIIDEDFKEQSRLLEEIKKSRARIIFLQKPFRTEYMEKIVLEAAISG